MIGYNLISTSYRKKEALSTKSLLQFSSNSDFIYRVAFMEYKGQIEDNVSVTDSNPHPKKTRAFHAETV